MRVSPLPPHPHAHQHMHFESHPACICVPGSAAPRTCVACATLMENPTACIARVSISDGVSGNDSPLVGTHCPTEFATVLAGHTMQRWYTVPDDATWLMTVVEFAGGTAHAHVVDDCKSAGDQFDRAEKPEAKLYAEPALPSQLMQASCSLSGNVFCAVETPGQEGKVQSGHGNATLLVLVGSPPHPPAPGGAPMAARKTTHRWAVAARQLRRVKVFSRGA